MRRAIHTLGAVVIVLAGSLPASSPLEQHPGPGTTLNHYAQVDHGVYRGTPPTNDADFEFLRARGVHYIVDLQFLPFLYWPEKRAAEKHGITFIHVFIPGCPFEPSQAHVTRALATIRKHRRDGVYFHCLTGRDRTSLIAALYKMYFLGESQRDAWQRNAVAFGFRDRWMLRGLKDYFYRHPKASPALLKASREAISGAAE